MLCQKCGKNIAEVHSVTIINGKRKEEYLCADCAGKNKLDIGGPFNNMNDLFSDIFFNEVNTNKKMICSSCGYDYDDFIKTGYLGCPDCYESFRGKLYDAIKKYQGGNIENKEDVKKIKAAEEPKTDEIALLKEKLKLAIAEENFEEAAKLRDKIKEAENG